eukprot:15365359-Ditylum_brightwellii.AAC.1
MEFICAEGKIEKEVLSMFMKAFLCKPANEVSMPNNTYLYLYAKPTELPLYLKEFCTNEESVEESNVVRDEYVKIVDGLSMLTCVGYGKDNHPFLEAEQC